MLVEHGESCILQGGIQCQRPAYRCLTKKSSTEISKGSIAGVPQGLGVAISTESRREIFFARNTNVERRVLKAVSTNDTTRLEKIEARAVLHGPSSFIHTPFDRIFAIV